MDELPPGTRKFLTIDERPIAIFNIKGEFFGLLNRCPHQGAALCEGPLIGLAQSSDPGEIEYTRLGEIIRCPWHGHVIAPVDELPPGTRKFLTIDERPIAIFNIKGEFFGLLNRCPHQGAALCEGPLIGLAQSTDPGEIEYTKLGEIIRCPWHGWEFDIRTGQSYCDPKRFRARAYPVNVEPGSAW